MLRKFVFCESCKDTTEHFMFYDAPYGIAYAVMAGSERYKCLDCLVEITVAEAKKAGIETRDNYRFLENGIITKSDILRIIKLTEYGLLSWYRDANYYAFIGLPSDSNLRDNKELCETIIGENLLGIRFGFLPDTKLWHYLRLTDGNMNYMHIEGCSYKELRDVVDTLFELVAF